MVKLEGNVASDGKFRHLRLMLMPMLVLVLKRACRGTPSAACAREVRQRVVHDGANGARATPALRAAAETAIDLRGRARAIGPGIHAGADVSVGEEIAGTNDHAGSLSLERLKTVASATIRG